MVITTRLLIKETIDCEWATKERRWRWGERIHFKEKAYKLLFWFTVVVFWVL